MPKLSNIKMEQEPQSAIFYGPPKSGKTELAVKGLAMAGFNVLYVDLEKGRTTLMKLAPELQEKVDVIAVYDTKGSPNAIATSLKLASGAPTKICIKHGATKCKECLANKEAEWENWTLNDLDPSKWAVVFDSFTQLTSSANAHVNGDVTDITNVSALLKDKSTFDHWRLQGTLLEKFLDYLQNARFNVILITHEMGIDQTDGTEKIQPSGGTKNFARNVPKYFDHIVYVGLKNKKHRASSKTTDENRIMSGSRTDVVINMDTPETVGQLFGRPAASDSTVVRDSKSKSALSNTSRLRALKK